MELDMIRSKMRRGVRRGWWWRQDRTHDRVVGLGVYTPKPTIPVVGVRVVPSGAVDGESGQQAVGC
jgi:hypothetical protein